MNTESLKENIRRELPALLREDASLRSFILELVSQDFPRREETNDRFYQMLGELRRDREEQTRKWEDNNRKWEDNNRQVQQDREEQTRKWEENNRQVQQDREEQTRKWEENSRQWKESKVEQNQKWEDANQRFDALHQEIMAQASKVDRSIGALGSRWGIQSEKAFRDALAAILEKSFGVQVINVNEYDDVGEVFGRPDQVELDVIIKNGLLIICELKSSFGKADMYIFERKVRFYEKRHQQQANRLIAISPMIDARARRVGDQLGIEMYGDSLDVPQ
ncbi:MAG: DUF3782 domain-containing protein [Proteobacteria bacterium]|nr:DUF3782 domain-containing protein [Pseudomonadota bacterium]